MLQQLLAATHRCLISDSVSASLPGISFIFPVRFERLQSLLPLKCRPTVHKHTHTHTHSFFQLSNCAHGKMANEIRSRISTTIHGREYCFLVIGWPKESEPNIFEAVFSSIFNLLQLPFRDAERIMCIFSIVLIHFFLLCSFIELGWLVVELLKSGVFETNVIRSLLRPITRAHRLSLHLLNNVILLWLIIIALLNV